MEAKALLYAQLQSRPVSDPHILVDFYQKHGEQQTEKEKDDYESLRQSFYETRREDLQQQERYYMAGNAELIRFLISLILGRNSKRIPTDSAIHATQTPKRIKKIRRTLLGAIWASEAAKAASMKGPSNEKSNAFSGNDR